MGENINYRYEIPKDLREPMKALADASNQAYNLFDSDNPTHPYVEKVTALTGFEYINSWTGVDEVFDRDKTEEVYGAVFRSTQDPTHYLFAFRGTASTLDVLDDLGAEHHSFEPYRGGVKVPDGVKVEAGFYDVYRTAMDKKPSMQTQLFNMVDQYQKSEHPIQTLWVTGHSLGAAICQLFTLDLAISRPRIEFLNINFASPRVGNSDFVKFYESTSAKNTIRVQNTYDKVPCVPPHAMGYAHTSEALLIAFYKQGLLGKLDYLHCHSMDNYQAVVNLASDSEDNWWKSGELKVAANHETLELKKPDSSEIGGVF